MYIPTDIVNLILSYSPYWFEEHKRKMSESLLCIEKYDWGGFYAHTSASYINCTYKCDMCKKTITWCEDTELCLPCISFLKYGYGDDSNPLV